MDEGEDLGVYIIRSYRHLLTELEHAAATAMMMEEKAASSSNATIAAKLRTRSPANAPEVQAMLSAGPEQFWRGVSERLLRERAAEFELVRCGRCGRLLRTPKAKQCLSCGLDWH